MFCFSGFSYMKKFIKNEFFIKFDILNDIDLFNYYCKCN